MTAQELQQRQLFWYQATLTFAGTAVGSTAQDTFRVTETPFVCVRILAIPRTPATGRIMSSDDNDGAGELGGQPDPSITFQIQETGSDRLLSTVQVDGYVVHPGRVAPLAVPKLFRRAALVTVSGTLLKVWAAAPVVRFVFEGFHDYDLAGI